MFDFSHPFLFFYLFVFLLLFVFLKILGGKVKDRRTQILQPLEDHEKTDKLIKESLSGKAKASQQKPLPEKNNKNIFSSLALDEELLKAGYYKKEEQYFFKCIQIFLSLTSFGIFFIYFYTSGRDNISAVLKFCCLISSLFSGHYLIKFFLRWKIRQDSLHMQKYFPLFMEILNLSLIAGINVNEGMHIILHDLKNLSKELKQEIELTLAELYLNPNPHIALENLAKRQSIPIVKQFVTILKHGDKTGAEISSMLESAVLEENKKQIARFMEKAQRLPALLTIPLVLLILPAILIILVGPYAVLLKRGLSGVLKL